MDFWIQTGSPRAHSVPGVVFGLTDAMAEMYPPDTERMILSWNGVPISLVYGEDVRVMLDDIAVMLERLRQDGEVRFSVRWGPSAFQAEWWIERQGADLVIVSNWDVVAHGPEDLLNLRNRLVVPEEHFRREWQKVLRLVVDDVIAQPVAMEDTTVLNMVVAALSAEADPEPTAGETTGEAVTFYALADDDEESHVVLWQAEADAARLFTGYAALVSRMVGVESGILPDAEIDVDGLGEFCAASLARYGGIAQGVERSLTVGFLAVALELLRRAGQDVPETDPAEQRAAWIALRDQHAAQMPR